jgi:hypothetical protein
MSWEDDFLDDDALASIDLGQFDTAAAAAGNAAVGAPSCGQILGAGVTAATGGTSGQLPSTAQQSSSQNIEQELRYKNAEVTNLRANLQQVSRSASSCLSCQYHCCDPWCECLMPVPEQLKEQLSEQRRSVSACDSGGGGNSKLGAENARLRQEAQRLSTKLEFMVSERTCSASCATRHAYIPLCPCRLCPLVMPAHLRLSRIASSGTPRHPHGARLTPAPWYQ